eukprot:TRINITY_DN66079_c6_g1_i1.p1 TRINITY_DN66079_c6_g1~~TRINITY_DN66079_c6_g1_i1.p1  ORF type:complete len:1306 (+),score=662.47 TRINITY_DN66079_c6_g1_i1:30-3947(+)
MNSHTIKALAASAFVVVVALCSATTANAAALSFGDYQLPSYAADSTLDATRGFRGQNAAVTASGRTAYVLDSTNREAPVITVLQLRGTGLNTVWEAVQQVTPTSITESASFKRAHLYGAQSVAVSPDDLDLYVATEAGVVQFRLDTTQTGGHKIKLTGPAPAVSKSDRITFRRQVANPTAAASFYKANSTSGFVQYGDIMYSGLTRTRVLTVLEQNRTVLSTITGATNITASFATRSEEFASGYSLLENGTDYFIVGPSTHECSWLISKTARSYLAVNASHSDLRARQDAAQRDDALINLAVQFKVHGRNSCAHAEQQQQFQEQFIFIVGRSNEPFQPREKLTSAYSTKGPLDGFVFGGGSADNKFFYSTERALDPQCSLLAHKCEDDFFIYAVDGGVLAIAHNYDDFNSSTTNATDRSLVWHASNLLTRYSALYTQHTSANTAGELVVPAHNITFASATTLVVVGGLKGDQRLAAYRKPLGFVRTYTRDATTGVLTLASSFNESVLPYLYDPTSVTVTANAKHLYVASAGFNGFHALPIVWTFEAGTGASFSYKSNVTVPVRESSATNVISALSTTQVMGTRLHLSLSQATLHPFVHVVSYGLDTSNTVRVVNDLASYNRSATTGAISSRVLVASFNTGGSTDTNSVQSMCTVNGDLFVALQSAPVDGGCRSFPKCLPYKLLIYRDTSTSVSKPLELVASRAQDQSQDNSRTLESMACGSRGASVFLRGVYFQALTVYDPPPFVRYNSGGAIKVLTNAALTVTPDTSSAKGLTFSISPALPTGVTLNSATGQIVAVVGATVRAKQQYTVTATNSGGSVVGIVELEVADPSVIVHTGITGISYTHNPAVYTYNRTITANTLTRSAGTITAVSVDPALPTGLALNAATGEITGTPTQVSSERVYSVSITSPFGNEVATLVLRVVFPAPNANAAVYNNGQKVTFTHGTSKSIAPAPLTVPELVTNSHAVTYSISPALPNGLTLNVTTGVISGVTTNFTAIGERSYVVTATSSGGSVQATLLVSIIDKSGNDIPPTGTSSAGPVTIRTFNVTEKQVVDELDGDKVNVAIGMASVSSLMVFVFGVAILVMLLQRRHQIAKEESKTQAHVLGKLQTRLDEELSKRQREVDERQRSIELQTIEINQKIEGLAQAEADRLNDRKHRLGNMSGDDSDEVATAAEVLTKYLSNKSGGSTKKRKKKTFEGTALHGDDDSDSSSSDSSGDGGGRTAYSKLFAKLGIDAKYEQEFVRERIQPQHLELLTLKEMSKLIDDPKQCKRLFRYVAKKVKQAHARQAKARTASTRSMGRRGN